MKNKYSMTLTVGLIVLICFGGCGRSDAPVALESLSLEEDAPTGEAATADDKDTASFVKDEEALEKGAEKGTVKVHVCGAVKEPGVYELPSDARVADALLAAGDFLQDADTDYWNQAAKLADGQQIYVPTEEETQNGSMAAGLSPDGSEKGPESGLLNVNTATLTQLMSLPGIGEVKANAIIAYREAKGPFSTTDEILKVDGIKEGVYQKIQDLICVN